MNSFNHYAYGAVADWIYGAAAGIQAVEDAVDDYLAENLNTLNKTIEDLSAVVERLAKITKFLG